MLRWYRALETLSIGTHTFHVGDKFRVSAPRGAQLEKAGKAAPVESSTGAALPAEPAASPSDTASEGIKDAPNPADASSDGEPKKRRRKRKAPEEAPPEEE